MSDRIGTSGVSGGGQDPAKPAAQAARDVGEQVKTAGAQVTGHAAEVLQDAQARGASLAGTVKDRAASAAQAGKDGLAERLEDVAKAVHRSGEQFEGHQDWIAHVVERGADELGALASTMRTNDLQGLLGKLEDLARRQPAVFVGAAMAAGFAAVRFGRVAASGATRDDLPSMPAMGRRDDP